MRHIHQNCESHPSKGGGKAGIPPGILLSLWVWAEGELRVSSRGKKAPAEEKPLARVQLCRSVGITPHATRMPVPKGRSGCSISPGPDSALEQTQECPELTDLH